MMDRDTKKVQKHLNRRIVDIAYGITMGAAMGAAIGVMAAMLASAVATSILPIVVAVAGASLGGFFAVGIIANQVDGKENNSSKFEK